jgi:hypothetical protein
VPGLTSRQQAILTHLRSRSEPVTVCDDLCNVTTLDDPWGMGFDRAHAAVNRLVKLGLARRLPTRRLPTRPAQYEAVLDA